MKVLFVIPGFVPVYGGPYFVLQGLLPALQQEGVQVRVLTTDLVSPAGAREQNLCGESFPVRWAPAHLHYHWASLSPAFFSCAAEEIGSVDLVHICGYRDGLGAVASRQARRLGKPVCWEPMGMARAVGRSRIKKRFYDRLIGSRTLIRAHRLIATSPLEMDELQGITGGGTPYISLRANGLDPMAERYATGDPVQWQRQARKRLGWDPGEKWIVNLGRIERRKGLLYLAERLQSLRGTRLALIGPDEGDGTLQQVQQILGTRVLVPGPVWGEDRWDWLAAADAFALPSLYGENFAIAALEAAAVGTPVLLSPQVGCGSMLGQSGTRILSLIDPKQWSDLLKNPPARSSTAEVTRLRAKFSWQNLAREQMAIYRDLLSPDGEVEQA